MSSLKINKINKKDFNSCTLINPSQPSKLYPPASTQSTNPHLLNIFIYHVAVELVRMERCNRDQLVIGEAAENPCNLWWNELSNQIKSQMFARILEILAYFKKTGPIPLVPDQLHFTEPLLVAEAVIVQNCHWHLVSGTELPFSYTLARKQT